MNIQDNISSFSFHAGYFSFLTVGNFKCFKEDQVINFTNKNGKPAQWTVILGNNNTGKTTLLKCLAALEPKEVKVLIGEENSTLPEIQEGKKSLSILASMPSLVAPNPLFRDFSLPTSYTLYCDFLLSESIVTPISSNNFTSFNEIYDTKWGVVNDATYQGGPANFNHLIPLFSYGASRNMSRKALSETINVHKHGSLFENRFLPNIEDWLLSLFLASKLGQDKAGVDLELAKKILKSGILPDILDLKMSSNEKENGFENFVEFLTDFGWVRMRDLGFGYQTMIVWILDLMRRLIERYPQSIKPLEEPAIVLVDEIDLHLHPDWQRKIIAYLTKHFPNVQFIVTAHSPLIVQSADEVNLVLLKKNNDRVQIEQPELRTFKGWTIEEILSHLMDLDGATMSETYLKLIAEFENALDSDNWKLAKHSYEALKKILHPDNPQRRIMEIQMTRFEPA